MSLNVPELAVFRFITGIGLGADLNLVSIYITEFAPAAVRGCHIKDITRETR